MAAIKYIARLDGQIVGTRTSAAQRVYTHAVVVNGHGKTNHVITWCGRIDLAQGEKRKAERYGYRAEIVKVDIVEPKGKPEPKVEAIAAPAAEAPIAEAPAPRASKITVENVHVDNVSRPDGRSYAIGWNVGADRFHVWVKRGEIEETIYKNPPVELERGTPGHYETRQLNRSSKASAAIFAEVMAIVDRDDLVAKARIADREAIERSRQISEIRSEAYQVRERVLAAWQAGRFADSQVATELLVHANQLDQQIDQLGGAEAAE